MREKRRRPRWLTDHTELYLSDPVAAHDWDATPVGGTGLVPTLLLTTTGHKSGLQRSTPLLYQPSGKGFIVVGSKGGARNDPAWLTNLRNDPSCSVQVGRFHCSATARILTGAQRVPYWEWMTRFWPGYNKYQAKTSREIPVVILETG